MSILGIETGCMSVGEDCTVQALEEDVELLKVENMGTAVPPLLVSKVRCVAALLVLKERC